MKKTTVLVMLMLFVLTGSLFAKPTKAQVLNLFDTYARNGVPAESTVKSVVQTMKSKKGDVKKLLSTAYDYSSKLSDLAELADLYWSWKWGDEKGKTNSVNKATNKMLDTVDFVTGKLVGAQYFKAVTEAGRAYLKVASKAHGATMFDIYAVEADSRWNHNAGEVVHLCFYPENYDFAKAWFSMEYEFVKGGNEKAQAGRDTTALHEIGKYIRNLRELRDAGIIQ